MESLPPEIYSLSCEKCGQKSAKVTFASRCSCGGAKFVEFNLTSVSKDWHPDELQFAVNSLWRYARVLPAAAARPVTLQEGWTPQLRTPSLGRAVGLHNLWIKDESRNPTGSFQARGMSVAVTAAKEAGIQTLAVASHGNAAAALAAYCAVAALPAQVYLPFNTPRAAVVECEGYGAGITLVDGYFDRCLQAASRGAEQGGWLDLSRPGEPYRMEGAKTIGYEIAEQFSWKIPDVVLCPSQARSALLGMWKAFDELEQLGWIGAKRPRMVAVRIAAPSLRPANDPQLQKVTDSSSGLLLSVSAEGAENGALLLCGKEGILGGPEAGACVAVLPQILASGFLQPAETVVLLNPASGLKSAGLYFRRFPRRQPGEQDKLGGLITPR